MFSFLKKIRYATRSPKWTNVRKQHLLNNPNCAACGRNKKLEVHHKTPVHINPEGELDPSNLMTLCADPCHIIFGHLMDFKSWNINVVEDCKVYLNRVNNKPLK
jgi:5-methylcytosine-specific restriction endonuclease McrA